MKILCIYYTGTYNTRYLTKMLTETLAPHGHSVTAVEIAADTPPVSTEGYDLIGFGYPIYGFNSPLPFNRYVQKLRFAAGQRYFIYKNSGETLAMNNASSRILLRRMKRQGAVCVGEYHFVMPYNIHFRFDRDFVREILQKDRKLCEILRYNLENGVVASIPSKRIYNIAAATVGIQKIGGPINSFLYRVDTKKCTLCGLCVRSCPEKNISVRNGKIKFSRRCDMCMRCSFFCPQDAIHIGFLEGWKVNGDYRLQALEQDPSPVPQYINADSRGFYRCFIRTFAEIDSAYEKIFAGQNKAE